MVKLLFAGIVIFALLVVGAFAAIFSPIWSGAVKNLGGQPTLPFTSPVPQPVMDAVHLVWKQATPEMVATILYGIIALLIVYTFGNMISYTVRRWKGRQALWIELRRRARVTAARQAKVESSQATQKKTEFESMWK